MLFGIALYLGGREAESGDDVRRRAMGTGRGHGIRSLHFPEVHLAATLPQHLVAVGDGLFMHVKGMILMLSVTESESDHPHSSSLRFQCPHHVPLAVVELHSRMFVK